MRYSEFANLKECTTAGGVASVPGNGGSSKGTIGAGFDSNGDWGIYDFAKKSSKKKDKKETKESEENDISKDSVIRR